MDSPKPQVRQSPPQAPSAAVAAEAGSARPSAGRAVEALEDQDPLTGIANRSRFESYLISQLMAIKESDIGSGGLLSVMLIDVDRFCQYNDTYGSQKGDDVLKDLAHCIRQSLLRGSDMVARFDGPEFIVALPKTPVQGAMEVAERIRCNVNSMSIDFPLDPENTCLSVSIGICSQQRLGMAASELIERADQALRRAKVRGRNQVESSLA